MPSTSPKQHRFMEAIAHGMKPKMGGPSVKVAKEFVAADRRKSVESRTSRAFRKTERRK